MVFTIFCCLFVKNINKKILFASQKSFISCENPYSNPLLESCSDSSIAGCEALKVVLKTVCDHKNCLKSRP